MACTAVVEGGVPWYGGMLVCLCLVELKGMRKLIKINLSDGDVSEKLLYKWRREASVHAN